jgi:hypothetical protein
VFAALVGLNVHRVPFGPAEEAAAEYEAAMRAMPREIVGVCDRSGKEMPSLDLCLLGSGADGHCASLYPHSAQVVCSPGCDRVYLPAEGKGGITLSIDTRRQGSTAWELYCIVCLFCTLFVFRLHIYMCVCSLRQLWKMPSS